MVSLRPALSQTASAWVGAALGGVTWVAGLLRPTAKPLHPRGTLRRGLLERHGTEAPTGVAFLDETGSDEVVVRESRAAGLPRPLPDVHGLALRVPVRDGCVRDGPVRDGAVRDGSASDGSVGDVLFSTTGTGPLTRFVLVPSRTRYSRPMTTLLPYDTAAGPVVLAVRAVAEQRLELAFAVGDGPWTPFADLTLLEEVDGDVSFDAVRNTLPGLRQYAAVRRLREPSYAAARASRDG